MSDLILAIDLGSSSLRASAVNGAGRILKTLTEPIMPHTPTDGIVQYDATQLASVAIKLATQICSEHSIAAVGITDQRASTLIWERETGIAPFPMISWQDLRTVGECLELQQHGLRLLPNQSATKLQHLLAQVEDPTKYCFGTPESWLVWNLTEGQAHITDATHAAVTGMIKLDGSDWSEEYLSILDIPAAVLPEIVDCSAIFANATVLPGAPPITGLIGDQQASLIGQGCLAKGQGKITFGTSAMLNVVTQSRPEFDLRGKNGTFPIIAWRADGQNIWGIEAAMLNAGSALDWACQVFGIKGGATQAESLIAPESGGIKFIPALTGLGTPYWDFGARGIFIGLNTSTTQGQMLRAVFEGIANHAVDLIEAATQDAGKLECIRIDGAMSKNKIFTQILADAANREIQVSKHAESTSLGAAYLAGTGIGIWENIHSTAELYEPAAVVLPENQNIRDGWAEAVEMARGFLPDLSAIEF